MTATVTIDLDSVAVLVESNMLGVEVGIPGLSGPQGEPGADSTVPGPTGPTGPPGPQGIPGPEGPVGLPGLDGLDGLDGVDGADSTVPGPTGPKGDKGDTGATGATGPTGPSGAADLTNVNNTSDMDKPVSTAQAIADALHILKAGDTLDDGANLTLGTVTGTKIGTGGSQKLGFFNVTPVGPQSATTDLGSVLSNFGLRSAGTAYPISTSGALAFTGALRFGTAFRTANATPGGGNTVPYNFMDATSGNLTATLTATPTPGFMFTIMKTDATPNTVTILAAFLNSTATQVVLTAQWQSITVMSTSVSGAWIIIGTTGLISTATQAALDTKIAGANGALTLWKGTQAQYDAIGTKSNSTVYVVA